MTFTREQFLDVFIRYNTTVFPVQILLFILGIAAIYYPLKKTSGSDKYTSVMLSFLWLWMGIVYHLIFFSPINKAAYVFGALFIIQGGVFIYSGVLQKKLRFGFKMNGFSVTGLIFILYGFIIYPVLGYFLGHVYPKSPTFGLPCPTTIFTFGLLLLSDKRIPKYILIIPVIWTVIGFFAALNFGIYEDIGLPVTGLTALTLIIIKDKRMKPVL